MTKKKNQAGHWGAVGVVGPETFDALKVIAEKHGCSLGALVGIGVACQLDRWEPDFRKSMVALFGKDAGGAIDALHLEGWLAEDGAPRPPTEGEPASGGPSSFSSPVDSLADAWDAAAGTATPGLTRRRLYSQMSAKFPGGAVRFAKEAALLYLSLFPEGTVQSFVFDAYKYPSTFDEAVIVSRGESIGPEFLDKWKLLWKAAAASQPGTKWSEDPYLFFCAAANPKFDVGEFRKHLVSYNIWDALTLAGSRRAKRMPDVTALSKGED